MQHADRFQGKSRVRRKQLCIDVHTGFYSAHSSSRLLSDRLYIKYYTDLLNILLHLFILEYL
jgi:hypothetical protein